MRSYLAEQLSSLLRANSILTKESHEVLIDNLHITFAADGQDGLVQCLKCLQIYFGDILVRELGLLPSILVDDNFDIVLKKHLLDAEVEPQRYKDRHEVN